MPDPLHRKAESQQLLVWWAELSAAKLLETHLRRSASSWCDWGRLDKQIAARPAARVRGPLKDREGTKRAA